jgi:hypothetical protein
MKCPPDNCPECVTGPNTPHTTRSDKVCIVGAYRCRECGHTWTTAWDVSALAEREFADDAA